MLAQFHDRVRHGRVHPEQAWPDSDGPRILALARQERESQTVILVLDATTATALCTPSPPMPTSEKPTSARSSGHNLPEDSYGRRNRQAIAAREARVASRLRAVEHAYRVAIEHDAAPQSA